MLAEIPGRTTPSPTSHPQITGNDIPDDVWRIIVRLVSLGGSVTQYMGVNRTFYNCALDRRYREVRWVVLDQDFVKQLDCLQSPPIAQRVHTLHIRAWFIQYLLKRDILFNSPSSPHKTKSTLMDSLLSISSTLGLDPFFKSRGWMLQHEDEQSKDSPLSFEATITSMIKAVEGMTNVVELNFEWRDLPLNKDTLMFLISTKRAFDNSLRKLTLRAPISKFRALLRNTNFGNIEELDFHFDYQTGHTSETSDPDVQNLLDTIIPFINQRRSSLQSLTISSSSSTDLSSFFSALPSDLRSLRRFGVDISFHQDFLSNPNGIIQFLESCAISLRHVSLLANWEHTHFGSVPKSQSADNSHVVMSNENNINTQSDNKPWVRMNNLLLAHPTCLSSLRSLQIPFISLGKTIPLVRRSSDTLTRLHLMGRYLTKNEVAEVVGLFSHRSLEFQHLELAVALLDYALLLTMATGLPDLISLVLIFEKYNDVLRFERSTVPRRIVTLLPFLKVLLSILTRGFFGLTKFSLKTSKASPENLYINISRFCLEIVGIREPAIFEIRNLRTAICQVFSLVLVSEI
ncbi:hypothetical protein CVT25_015333 [Psilocybe cyanescens]|uniref:Uncharacterized protein n=1 Tax=Psilocybe cyanescens TaxID=93625 RepID=A0A409WH64_PSICY|nr:hypothetical protein CVT25_015333 [Psilocybe cyanescens]